MKILKNKVTITGLVLFMGIVGLVWSATAQTPKPNVFDGGNRWLITAYDDTSPVHQQWATQGICFLPYAQHGTHIQGVWYSDTFPNWRGRYSQEGDRVLMHGDYANGVGHDGMVIELTEGTSPKDVGGGQWTEWRETGSFGTTIGFANNRLARVGRCQLAMNAHASQKSETELEKMAMDFSMRVKPRLRRDGRPAESPLDPDQVPLPEEKEFPRQ
jgi:hypothetical protein